MCSHVSGDHVSAAGGVGARRAAVGLLPGVGALVSGEVVRAREDLAAGGARVGLQPGVEARVTRQHV